MSKKMTFLLMLCLTTPIMAVNAQTDYGLFYDEPAQEWVEALPLGNGRLGAMVYGKVEQEKIQFNEETLWTGEPHDYSQSWNGTVLDDHDHLFAVRGELITNG